MKRTIVFLAVAALLLGTAGISFASGRYDDRHWRGEHRHGGSSYYSRVERPGISVTFSFPITTYRTHRRHYRPPRRTWVPGHWEYVRVWVPGRVERYWVPGHGGPWGYRPGYFETRRHGGEYRMKKVWRDGHRR